jgi:hypothetical protein
MNESFPSLSSKFPPSLYAVRVSKAHQEEIAGTFLVTLDPLISQLLACQPFMQVVLDRKIGKLQNRFNVKYLLLIIC